MTAHYSSRGHELLLRGKQRGMPEHRQHVECASTRASHVAAFPRVAAVKQGLHKLAACTSLQQLDLSYCQISGAGLAALRPLRRLSSLVLVVSALPCMRARVPCSMTCTSDLVGCVAARQAFAFSILARYLDHESPCPCLPAGLHARRLPSLHGAAHRAGCGHPGPQR